MLWYHTRHKLELSFCFHSSGPSHAHPQLSSNLWSSMGSERGLCCTAISPFLPSLLAPIPLTTGMKKKSELTKSLRASPKNQVPRSESCTVRTRGPSGGGWPQKTILLLYGTSYFSKSSYLFPNSIIYNNSVRQAWQKLLLNYKNFFFS